AGTILGLPGSVAFAGIVGLRHGHLSDDIRALPGTAVSCTDRRTSRFGARAGGSRSGGTVESARRGFGGRGFVGAVGGVDLALHRAGGHRGGRRLFGNPWSIWWTRLHGTPEGQGFFDCSAGSDVELHGMGSRDHGGERGGESAA